jgi:hypothetical protein
MLFLFDLLLLDRCHSTTAASTRRIRDAVCVGTMQTTGATCASAITAIWDDAVCPVGILNWYMGCCVTAAATPRHSPYDAVVQLIRRVIPAGANVVVERWLTSRHRHQCCYYRRS